MSKNPNKAFDDYVEEYGVYKKSTKESVADYVRQEGERQRKKALLREDEQGVINLKAVTTSQLKLWHKVMIAAGVLIVVIAVIFCIKLSG